MIENYDGELYANNKGVFAKMGITAAEVRAIVNVLDQITTLEKEVAYQKKLNRILIDQNANLKISITSVKTLFDSLFGN